MWMSRGLCVYVSVSAYMLLFLRLKVALHKYFCDPEVAGHKSTWLVSGVSFLLPITRRISLLQVWYFTTEPLMTDTPCPSLTPRECVWRTQQSSHRPASCRRPSLMDMTTVMPAGCLTRLYGEVINFTYTVSGSKAIVCCCWNKYQVDTLHCLYGCSVMQGSVFDTGSNTVIRVEI